MFTHSHRSIKRLRRPRRLRGYGGELTDITTIKIKRLAPPFVIPLSGITATPPPWRLLLIHQPLITFSPSPATHCVKPKFVKRKNVMSFSGLCPQGRTPSSSFSCDDLYLLLRTRTAPKHLWGWRVSKKHNMKLWQAPRTAQSNCGIWREHIPIERQFSRSIIATSCTWHEKKR